MLLTRTTIIDIIMFTQLRLLQGLRLDGMRRDRASSKGPAVLSSFYTSILRENGKWSWICHHSRIACILV